MESNFMCLHLTRLQLFKAVQEEFGRVYPFLKIEWLHPPDKDWMRTTGDADEQCPQVSDLLTKDIGLTGDLTVEELEHRLKEWFGIPVRLLRKSGRVWMDTSHTGDWSLKKQNDLGGSIAAGFQ